MKTRLNISLLFLFALAFNTAFSQDKEFRISHAVEVDYSFNFPFADLKANYGNHSEIGFRYRYYKRKWVLNAHANFLFGDQVNDTTLFDNITSSEGELLDLNGQFADVRVYERGGNFSAGIGYKWTSFGDLHLYSELNVGYLLHKTRIETIGNSLPNLTKEYKRGYDQLSGGLLMRKYLGFHYIGDHHLVNFTFGVTYNYAQTKLLRSYDYKSGQFISRTNNDQYFGIQVGWIVPFYKAPAEKAFVF